MSTVDYRKHLTIWKLSFKRPTVLPLQKSPSKSATKKPVISPLHATFIDFGYCRTLNVCKWMCRAAVCVWWICAAVQVSENFLHGKFSRIHYVAKEARRAKYICCTGDVINGTFSVLPLNKPLQELWPWAVIQSTCQACDRMKSAASFHTTTECLGVSCMWQHCCHGTIGYQGPSTAFPTVSLRKLRTWAFVRKLSNWAKKLASHL